MASRSLDDCAFPLKMMAEQLFGKCAELGIPIQITRTYSTQEEQNKLFAEGKTFMKTSLHSVVMKGGKKCSYAIDFAIMRNGRATPALKGEVMDENFSDYIAVGKMAMKIGLDWAGSWPKKKRDYRHVQIASDAR